MILLIIFAVVLIYIYFKKKTIEEFESPDNHLSAIKFSEKSRSGKNGIFLNNNEGVMNNSPNLLSEESTVTMAYSLNEKDEAGILLHVPDNYCQISIESKDEQIHFFVSHLNKTYHYYIDRYVYRNQQEKLIISLVLSNTDQELYVNNKKLYLLDSVYRNDKSTTYNLTASPIIINKNKKLKGVLHGIITHNRVLSVEEIEEIYTYIKNNFITGVDVVDTPKPISSPTKTNTPCNFQNKDICDNCSQTQIDLVHSKVVYENKACEDKITGYCAANKDYICDIIDITNKLGKY